MSSIAERDKGDFEDSETVFFLFIFYVAVFLYQYWPGGFMVFVVLCPGTP